MKTLSSASVRAREQAKTPAPTAKWPLFLAFFALCGAGFGVWRSRAVQVSQISQATQQTTQAPTVYAEKLGWKVIGIHPHDVRAFTQGLTWHEGGFYEGTGQEGKSQLRRVEFPSGRVLQKRNLPPEVFGEGIALAGDKIYQLTWQTRVGYVYDRASFKLLRQFTYPNEGWGLTYDGQNLIQSDGSAILTYLDPQRLQPVRQLKVTMNGQPLARLNELEWVNGEIWANVWQSDWVVCIDPISGQVLRYFDFKNLLPDKMRTGREDVLNGIAYDAEKKRLFLTGKWWPKLFEIKVLDGTA
jgi:glutamine cyclotransferase